MKAMKPMLLMIVTLGIAVATLPRAAEEDIDTVPATDAARAWLTIVDGGRYGESWQAAAEVFRNGVPQAQWETMVASVRGKVGNLMLRKPLSVKYARDLPNAPHGEYVVIQYTTRFENGLFTETVTPMKQTDGSWKVSGYYIK
jgi:Protein of unknown function (DUF4019)